jgi:hypothetical protein
MPYTILTLTILRNNELIERNTAINKKHERAKPDPFALNHLF